MRVKRVLKSSWRLAVASVLAALVALPISAVADEGGGSAPIPGRPVLAPASDHISLLDSGSTPLGSSMLRTLSGPGYLQSIGMDPRMGPTSAIDWNTLSGSDIRNTAASGSSSPGLQVGGVSVPYRNPAPSFSRNELITRDYSNTPVQLEPHMAIDPKDPDHIVVGVIDYNFPSVSVYVTFDGGATWEGPIQTRYRREDLIGAGDPVLAFDRKGTVYLASISLGIQDFLVGNFDVTAQTSSIAVTKSTDGGLTWSDPIASASRLPFTRLQPPGVDGLIRGTVSIPFIDKPWMSIGPDPTNPTSDIVHVSYTEFVDVLQVLYIGEVPTFALVESDSTIRTVHSTDQGGTWSDALSVSPTVRSQPSQVPQAGSALTQINTRVVQGSEPHVAPDGTSYVSWVDSTDDGAQAGLAELYIARSLDGGRSYGKPIRTTVFDEPSFRSRTAFFRYWSTAFPHVAIGPAGEVYMVFGGLDPGNPVDDGEIFFQRSTDRGVTWSPAKRVGSPDVTSLQFFPAIATDPVGNIHIMWGDMRDDPKQTSYNIYYTTSTDKGATWGFTDPKNNLHTDDTRVSDYPSNPNKGFPGGQFIGDYFAIAASKTDVAMVWADTRLGEFGGGFNQKVGFARKRAIPAPSVFISPPTGPGGQNITVQGFNLQPGINAFIQVGGQVVQTQRSDTNGRFTAQLFVPVTGEGSQDVRVIDDSGNVASTSYFTSFGFGSIQDSQQKLQAQITALGGGKGGALTSNANAQAMWILVAAAGVGGLGVGAAVFALLARRPRNRTDQH